MKHLASVTTTATRVSGLPLNYITEGDEYVVSLYLNCNHRRVQWPCLVIAQSDPESQSGHGVALHPRVIGELAQVDDTLTLSVLHPATAVGGEDGAGGVTEVKLSIRRKSMVTAARIVAVFASFWKGGVTAPALMVAAGTAAAGEHDADEDDSLAVAAASAAVDASDDAASAAASAAGRALTLVAGRGGGGGRASCGGGDGSDKPPADGYDSPDDASSVAPEMQAAAALGRILRSAARHASVRGVMSPGAYARWRLREVVNSVAMECAVLAGVPMRGMDGVVFAPSGESGGPARPPAGGKGRGGDGKSPSPSAEAPAAADEVLSAVAAVNAAEALPTAAAGGSTQEHATATAATAGAGASSGVTGHAPSPAAPPSTSGAPPPPPPQQQQQELSLHAAATARPSRELPGSSNGSHAAAPATGSHAHLRHGAPVPHGGGRPRGAAAGFTALQRSHGVAAAQQAFHTSAPPHPTGGRYGAMSDGPGVSAIAQHLATLAATAAVVAAELRSSSTTTAAPHGGVEHHHLAPPTPPQQQQMHHGLLDAVSGASRGVTPGAGAYSRQAQPPQGYAVPLPLGMGVSDPGAGDGFSHPVPYPPMAFGAVQGALGTDAAASRQLHHQQQQHHVQHLLQQHHALLAPHYMPPQHWSNGVPDGIGELAPMHHLLRRM